MTQTFKALTKATGRTIKCMGMGFIDGAQASFTSDIGSMVRNMALEGCTSKEEIYMKVSL
eukprot:CAMPEP_0116889184 /NCGR_PEP_ID=MMETSP0463-20121206/24557_1 /TAXON_ID=181622 /ORGANISM="Strombidinopsis sp, Strain SopsisLIS2011" /LENGTH=59 /DNA_ID=CAMNT_0004555397 /DNA_START=981 /DNA_END=1160 /DNA_ORIENTATION=-